MKIKCVELLTKLNCAAVMKTGKSLCLAIYYYKQTFTKRICQKQKIHLTNWSRSKVESYNAQPVHECQQHQNPGRSANHEQQHADHQLNNRQPVP